MNSGVSLVKCKSYEPVLVQGAIRKAIDLIGGIRGFIKPESRVLVKPNLLMAKEPEFGITTHPEVVRAVIKILKEINCKIFVGDGPNVWGNQIEDVDEVYLRSGIKKISEEEGIELVKFDQRRWHRKIPLTTWLDDCDYLVNLPKFKTHNYTILTGAIKNLFGLVPGTYKIELHKNYFDVNDFSKMLVDIYEIARPALTIVDGVVAMEGEGPATGGKLRQMNLLLASCDGVAVDCLMALIMGIQPHHILSTREAAKRSLGVADINSILVLGEKLEDVRGEPFLLPSTSTLRKRLPRPIIELARRLIKYYPYIERDNCINCAACIQACPNKIISMKNDRIVFDYSKCIACFCCQEVCPNSAIKVKKSIFAKLIGL
jgi:uncharacterized protein (DUF362 family)/Pyruvate/2-oxoacid:ferredoxin oxidoreductase delta subunit